MRTLTALLLIAACAAPAWAEDDFKREGDGAQRSSKDGIEKKAPPALEVKEWLNTEGKGLKFEDLKGKVVVLDFWGTWCGPCRAAMPKLKDLYHKHKDEGLVVIGIHTTRGGEKMAAYVKEEKLDWPIALDVDGKTVKAFHVDSFPDYYLIDRAGNLRVADLANNDLERAIAVLLKEKVAK